MNYFRVNFSLINHHKFSLTEFNDMIPWEKQIYVRMLNDYIKEQNEKMKQLQAQNKSRRR